MHKPPSFKEASFDCPNCFVLAKQDWSTVATYNLSNAHQYAKPNNNQSHWLIDTMWLSLCQNCKQPAVWYKGAMVYPPISLAPPPNVDMPVDVRDDYEEASQILMKSPKGAAALLRLALQKLCVHLGEKGKNINDDIKELVKKGVPKEIQQALDFVRIVGNNAVHPGQIDVGDNVQIAYKLFVFVNVICDRMITQPKAINDAFLGDIPEDLRKAVEARDQQRDS